VYHRRIAVAVLLMAFAGFSGRAEPAEFLSHPPMRPLPEPSKRPIAKGPARFVDAARGDDANDGSLDAPWKTIAHGLKQMKPGDTLYLRGGTYYEPVVVAVSGAPGKPITICGYPGEIAVIDAGLRDFFENPAEAWEPFEGGAEGEYRSKKPCPDIGREAHPRRYVYVMGNFGDSMIPLHGYRNLIDLRWPDMYRAFDHGMSTAGGMYCGPGVWYDAQPIGSRTYGTKKIHIRLAHTKFPALGDKNYTGETDPRRLRLVISGPRPALAIEGAKHVRIQDIVLRGSRSSTLKIEGAEDIELDGLTIYGGAPALYLQSTKRLRLLNSALRGVSAPWSSRGSEKYRGVSTCLVVASSNGTPRNDDIEFGFCEFTDCHDGLWLLGIRNLKLHHSLVDNFNDDGLEFGPKRPGRRFLIYLNRISRCLTSLTLHGSWREVPTERGSGVYIFGNVFDLREPVHYAWPGKDGPQEITSRGRLVGDHGSPTWPVYYLYHNTILVHESSWRSHYGAGLARATRGTRRRVLNNIIVHLEGTPGFRFPAADQDWFADGQLHWSVKHGAALTATGLAALVKRANRKGHPALWGANDRLADPKFVSFQPDWRRPSDLRLRNDSPAIDAGVAVPKDWPDPMRAADKGKPDIGAFPLGAGVVRIGAFGRYTLSGGERRP